MTSRKAYTMTNKEMIAAFWTDGTTKDIMEHQKKIRREMEDKRGISLQKIADVCHNFLEQGAPIKKTGGPKDYYWEQTGSIYNWYYGIGKGQQEQTLALIKPTYQPWPNPWSR